MVILIGQLSISITFYPNTSYLKLICLNFRNRCLATSTLIVPVSTIIFAIISMFVLFLSVVWVGVANAQQSVVDEYPELKPLTDFVGEENLSVLHLAGFRAAKRAMAELGFEKGDANILVLTDAGYIAKIGEYTTEKALDGVMLTSGCSRGKGNLVNVHKPYNSPLWLSLIHI